MKTRGDDLMKAFGMDKTILVSFRISPSDLNTLAEGGTVLVKVKGVPLEICVHRGL